MEVLTPAFELEFTPVSMKVKTENTKCVYGIFIGESLVYIGYTWSGFGKRVKYHEEAIEDKKKEEQWNKELYQALRNSNGDYSYKILYRCPEEMGEYGLQFVEKMLIETLQPKFNYEGVKVPYKFKKVNRPAAIR